MVASFSFAIADEALDPNYEYLEPTIVINSAEVGSNLENYSFVCNNVQVRVTKGARYSDYFGVNAGEKVTFTTTQPMKAIVVNGYIKKGFDATASSGSIDFADAEEEEVTAEQVLAVTDIDATTLTISCTKQLRCYSVAVYFQTIPDISIGEEEESDYSYEWEPTEVVTMNVTIDSLAYLDMTESLGYGCTDIQLFDRQNNYMMDLTVYTASVADGTILPVGIYPINFDCYEEGKDFTNTVAASVGGYDTYDFPSYFLTDVSYDENGRPYEYVPYYLVSGTLEVLAVEGGVQMNIHAASHFGSTINAVYFMGEGEPFDAVGDAAVDCRAVKILRDGHLFIQHNGVLFSIGGRWM